MGRVVQAGNRRMASGRVTPSKLRRTTVVALDGVLALGAGALGGLFATGTATAAAPTPGWTPVQAPLPTSPDAPNTTNPDVGVDSESCVSAVFCGAIGSYEDTGGTSDHLRGVLEVLNGGTWSATEAPLPSDASPTDPQVEMSGISCATQGSCVAVGQYKDTSDDSHTMIETYAGGHWSDFEPALPSDAASVSSGDYGAWLKSVSCPAAGDCVATGYYNGPTGAQVGLIETLSGGVWTPQAAPQPSDVSASDQVAVYTVSCPTTGFCGAAGYVYTGTRFVSELLQLSGGTWTAQDAPVPSDVGTGANQDFLLDQASCTSGACEVVGAYEDSAGNNHSVLEHLAGAGGTWVGTEAPAPGNAGSGSQQDVYVNAVSCTFDGVCIASGDFEDTSGHDRPLVETITNGAAVPLEAPQPSDASTTPDGYLGAVSCLSGTSCTAVGDYVTTQGDRAGLIDELSGGTWSTVTAPVPGNDIGAPHRDTELETVSCTSRGACNAGGFYQTTGPNEQGIFESYTPVEGYYSVASDGGIFNYGSANFHGSRGGQAINAPMVGIAATPGNGGYWEVGSDGGIFSYGNAVFHGSTGSLKLNAPIVGMAATPDGGGYWLVATDGGIFNYGDAGFYGSTGSIHLNKPIVGMASTPDGHGYWLVASDGGIFNYGDAGFYGSRGGQPLNKPIVGMAADATGLGYWLVASDGGIFNYGDSSFLGSRGGQPLNKPIVAMMSTFDGAGYWLTASDGGIFGYGDTGFYGSAGSIHLNAPVVSGTPS